MDDLLGVHPQMLAMRAERTAVIASNIANVDTPNYKARDISFEATLSGLSSSVPDIETEMQYRMPFQKSRTGNTVELNVEQAKFAQNTAEYHQSLQFLKSKVSGLNTAITGQ
ncbi:flagellar basal body protein [Vibrio breoganii]